MVTLVIVEKTLSAEGIYSTELIRAKKRAWKTKEYVLQKLVTEK